MVDISALSGLVTSLRAAGDLTKAAIGIRDGQMLQAKIIELQSIIMAAQSSALGAQQDQFELLERVRVLEDETKRVKNWENEKQRYKLEQLPPGILVYTLREGKEDGEPPHKICANCYQQGKKSLLNSFGEHMGLTRWTCHACGFSEESGRFVAPPSRQYEPYDI